MTQPGFAFGAVFHGDEILSEWCATLAMGFNDLSLAHVRREDDRDTDHLFFYWLRIGIAHYHERGRYLDESGEVQEASPSSPSRGVRNERFARRDFLMFAAAGFEPARSTGC